MTPSSFLWAGSDRPSLGSMIATSHFDDGATDDTTTGESATVTDTVGASCTKTAVTAYLTAVADFGQVVDLSGQEWRATGRGHNSSPDLISNCGLFPGDPNTPRPATQKLYLEISSDGSSWMGAASGDFSQVLSTLTGVFGDGLTARYVRAVVESFREVYAQSLGGGTFGTIAQLTDLRLVAGDIVAPPGGTTVTATGNVEPCGAVSIAVSGI